mmetsp:Transcript_32893/g.71780  ORF Transcript_32893/g.71780 Transcript_32893/m.71780 type:complete len:335 (-) Transcript_32893:169-1173(-)
MPPPSLGMELDDVDQVNSISLTWSIDPSGTMRHKRTGTKVSTSEGVTFGGQVFRLSPADIEIDTVTLGSGACGVVRKGTIKKTGIPVAIKTIKVDEKGKREQLLNEIRGLVEASECEYLVHWYAGFVSKTTSAVNVVLEFMDLGSLAQLKARVGGTGVPPPMLACISMQIMKGLNFLNGKHLLHRDIKPENILHNRLGQVKLTDFGIAKDMDTTMAMAGTFVGTVTYMSPERCIGESYDLHSDVWSVGMVIFELATGKFPFTDISTFPALFEHLCEKPEPRLDPGLFPPLLCDFVALCLTRDVSQRPNAPTLCAHDFVNRDVPTQAELAAWLPS